MSRHNKFNARAVAIDGEKFHSANEAKRWRDLQFLEAAGEIRNLARQVRYDLDVNGLRIATYTADFEYDELGPDGPVHIVEDYKSPPTMQEPAFRLKMKLMKAIHGIEVVAQDGRPVLARRSRTTGREIVPKR